MLESAGSGLALLDLPAGAALTAPTVSGVSALLPLSGAMYVLRDRAPPRRVEAGELALVPAGMRFRLSARRNATTTIDSRRRLIQRGRWIAVPVLPGEEALAQVAAARIIGSRLAMLDDLVVADVKGREGAAPLFERLVEEVRRGADGHAGLAMALMNACVVHAIRSERGERDPAPAPARSPRGGVGRALSAIHAHPGGDHSIDSLAQLVGMSRSSFLRGFAHATGAAPQRYLQQVRLEEAAALLRSTTLPVKVVAANTGFASRSHFSRAFRDAYTLDPSAYRQDASGDDVPVRAEAVREHANRPTPKSPLPEPDGGEKAHKTAIVADEQW